MPIDKKQEHEKDYISSNQDSSLSQFYIPFISQIRKKMQPHDRKFTIVEFFQFVSQYCLSLPNETFSPTKQQNFGKKTQTKYQISLSSFQQKSELSPTSCNRKISIPMSPSKKGYSTYKTTLEQPHSPHSPSPVISSSKIQRNNNTGKDYQRQSMCPSSPTRNLSVVRECKLRMAEQLIDKLREVFLFFKQTSVSYEMLNGYFLSRQMALLKDANDIENLSQYANLPQRRVRLDQNVKLCIMPQGQAHRIIGLKAGHFEGPNSEARVLGDNTEVYVLTKESVRTVRVDAQKLAKSSRSTHLMASSDSYQKETKNSQLNDWYTYSSQIITPQSTSVSLASTSSKNISVRKTNSQINYTQQSSPQKAHQSESPAIKSKKTIYIDSISVSLNLIGIITYDREFLIQPILQPKQRNRGGLQAIPYQIRVGNLIHDIPDANLSKAPISSDPRMQRQIKQSKVLSFQNYDDSLWLITNEYFIYVYYLPTPSAQPQHVPVNDSLTKSSLLTLCEPLPTRACQAKLLTKQYMAIMMDEPRPCVMILKLQLSSHPSERNRNRIYPTNKIFNDIKFICMDYHSVDRYLLFTDFGGYLIRLKFNTANGDFEKEGNVHDQAMARLITNNSTNTIKHNAHSSNLSDKKPGSSYTGSLQLESKQFGVSQKKYSKPSQISSELQLNQQQSKKKCRASFSSDIPIFQLTQQNKQHSSFQPQSPIKRTYTYNQTEKNYKGKKSMAAQYDLHKLVKDSFISKKQQENQTIKDKSKQQHSSQFSDLLHNKSLNSPSTKLKQSPSKIRFKDRSGFSILSKPESSEHIKIVRNLSRQNMILLCLDRSCSSVITYQEIPKKSAAHSRYQQQTDKTNNVDTIFDKTIRLWDLNFMTVYQTFKLSLQMSHMSLQPNGLYVVTKVKGYLGFYPFLAKQSHFKGNTREQKNENSEELQTFAGNKFFNKKNRNMFKLGPKIILQNNRLYFYTETAKRAIVETLQKQEASDKLLNYNNPVTSIYAMSFTEEQQPNQVQLLQQIPAKIMGMQFRNRIYVLADTNNDKKYNVHIYDKFGIKQTVLKADSENTKLNTKLKSSQSSNLNFPNMSRISHFQFDLMLWNDDSIKLIGSNLQESLTINWTTRARDPMSSAKASYRHSDANSVSSAAQKKSDSKKYVPNQNQSRSLRQPYSGDTRTVKSSTQGGMIRKIQTIFLGQSDYAILQRHRMSNMYNQVILTLAHLDSGRLRYRIVIDKPICLEVACMYNFMFLSRQSSEQASATSANISPFGPQSDFSLVRSRADSKFSESVSDQVSRRNRRQSFLKHNPVNKKKESMSLQFSKEEQHINLYDLKAPFQRKCIFSLKYAKQRDMHPATSHGTGVSALFTKQVGNSNDQLYLMNYSSASDLSPKKQLFYRFKIHLQNTKFCGINNDTSLVISCIFKIVTQEFEKCTQHQDNSENLSNERLTRQKCAYYLYTRLVTKQVERKMNYTPHVNETNINKINKKVNFQYVNDSELPSRVYGHEYINYNSIYSRSSPKTLYYGADLHCAGDSGSCNENFDVQQIVEDITDKLTEYILSLHSYGRNSKEGEENIIKITDVDEKEPNSDAKVFEWLDFDVHTPTSMLCLRTEQRYEVFRHQISFESFNIPTTECKDPISLCLNQTIKPLVSLHSRIEKICCIETPLLSNKTASSSRPIQQPLISFWNSSFKEGSNTLWNDIKEQLLGYVRSGLQMQVQQVQHQQTAQSSPKNVRSNLSQKEKTALFDIKQVQVAPFSSKTEKQMYLSDRSLLNGQQTLQSEKHQSDQQSKIKQQKDFKDETLTELKKDALSKLQTLKPLATKATTTPEMLNKMFRQWTISKQIHQENEQHEQFIEEKRKQLSKQIEKMLKADEAEKDLSHDEKSPKEDRPSGQINSTSVYKSSNIQLPTSSKLSIIQERTKYLLSMPNKIRRASLKQRIQGFQLLNADGKGGSVKNQQKNQSQKLKDKKAQITDRADQTCKSPKAIATNHNKIGTSKKNFQKELISSHQSQSQCQLSSENGTIAQCMIQYTKRDKQNYDESLTSSLMRKLASIQTQTIQTQAKSIAITQNNKKPAPPSSRSRLSGDQCNSPFGRKTRGFNIDNRKKNFIQMTEHDCSRVQDRNQVQNKVVVSLSKSKSVLETRLSQNSGIQSICKQSRINQKDDLTNDQSSHLKNRYKNQLNNSQKSEVQMLQNIRNSGHSLRKRVQLLESISERARLPSLPSQHNQSRCENSQHKKRSKTQISQKPQENELNIKYMGPTNNQRINKRHSKPSPLEHLKASHRLLTESILPEIKINQSELQEKMRKKGSFLKAVHQRLQFSSSSHALASPHFSRSRVNSQQSNAQSQELKANKKQNQTQIRKPV